MIPSTRSHAPDTALDIDHLDRQTCDDDALKVELLALFTGQARAILAVLEGVATGSPAPRGSRPDLLHMLCGSARAIGCFALAAEAERLERHARTPRDVDSGERNASLAQAVEEACTAAERHRRRLVGPA